MNCTDIRRLLSDAYQETWFAARSNQTYYPAAWRYGAGVGDAETSAYYDVRISVAADHVATVLELSEAHWAGGTCARRLYDAGTELITAYRAQLAADADRAQAEAH